MLGQDFLDQLNKDNINLSKITYSYKLPYCYTRSYHLNEINKEPNHERNETMTDIVKILSNANTDYITVTRPRYKINVKYKRDNDLYYYINISNERIKFNNIDYIEYKTVTEKIFSIMDIKDYMIDPPFINKLKCSINYNEHYNIGYLNNIFKYPLYHKLDRNNYLKITKLKQNLIKVFNYNVRLNYSLVDIKIKGNSYLIFNFDLSDYIDVKKTFNYINNLIKLHILLMGHYNKSSCFNKIPLEIIKCIISNLSQLRK